MPMSCPHCNSQVLNTHRFCRYCGYRLDQGLQDYLRTEALESNEQTTYTPGLMSQGIAPWMTPNQVMAQTTYLEKKSRKRRLFLIIGSIAMACALGGAVVFRAIPDRAFRGSAPAEAVAQSSFLGVDLGDEDRGGAHISEIRVDGGPADQAGLIAGDLIIEAAGRPIRSNGELRRLLQSTAPGTRLPLKVLRDSQTIELTLVTGAEEDFSAAPGRSGPVGFFGVYPDDAERVRVPGTQMWGITVRTSPNGPADLAGIKESDILIEFNGHPIRTPGDLSRRIRQTAPYETINIKVIRDGHELVVPVKLGRN